MGHQQQPNIPCAPAREWLYSICTFCCWWCVLHIFYLSNIGHIFSIVLCMFNIILLIDFSMLFLGVLDLEDLVPGVDTSASGLTEARNFANFVCLNTGRVQLCVSESKSARGCGSVRACAHARAYVSLLMSLSVPDHPSHSLLPSSGGIQEEDGGGQLDAPILLHRASKNQK